MFRERRLWTLIAILSAIGIAIVVRRAIALTGSAEAGLDAGFARFRLLTAVHIAPGLLFILLGPWQFVRRLRARRPVLHRWMGRVFLVSALIVGATAAVMTSRMAIGGAIEIAAVL